MKKIILSAASLAVAAVASVSVAPTTSEAVPAFARQTGAACLNCHFQAIPRLAQMGREFRMNSFRDISQDVMEDEHLSLGAVFNASFLMKARISSGSGNGSTKGGDVGDATATTASIQWPDEAALLFGGRLSEHDGFFSEWDVIGGSMLGQKYAHVIDMDAGLIAIAVGTTDALGASSIFNDPSNAVSRNTRGVQTRANSLRGGIHHAAATGLGVYGFVADSIYFAAGLVAAGGGFENGNQGIEVPTGTYVRAAYISEIAGLDTIVGAWSASTPALTVPTDKYTGATNGQIIETANGVVDAQSGFDVQIQGDVAGISLGFYMPVVLAGAGEGAAEVSGYMPYFNIGLTQAAGVRVGYDYSEKTGSKFSNVIVGAWYDLAQNVAIDLEYNARETKTATTSTNNVTTLMLEYVY